MKSAIPIAIGPAKSRRPRRQTRRWLPMSHHDVATKPSAVASKGIVDRSEDLHTLRDPDNPHEDCPPTGPGTINNTRPSVDPCRYPSRRPWREPSELNIQRYGSSSYEFMSWRRWLRARRLRLRISRKKRRRSTTC